MLMRNILILSVLFFCFSCKKESTVNPEDKPVSKAVALTIYYVDGAQGNNNG